MEHERDRTCNDYVKKRLRRYFWLENNAPLCAHFDVPYKTCKLLFGGCGKNKTYSNIVLSSIQRSSKYLVVENLLSLRVFVIFLLLNF